MKNFTGFIAFASMLLLVSCSNEPQPAAVAQPAPAKEVIVVKPEPVVVKQAPVVVIKEAPAKPTTITLNKNGVKVGTKKVQIDINKDNK